MLYYLHNPTTGHLIARPDEGELDGGWTYYPSRAMAFESWGAASDFSQNYGPDVYVIEGDDL
jgi:hypothetical protein